ncbi:MAG: aminopeptidase, partial [Thermoplasmata archaeon]|nr:aminopeptidase [Thermoplasmata archaeon]
AARVAVREVLDVRPGETLHIITNPEKGVYTIAQAIYDAAIEVGGKPLILVQPYKTQLDYAEEGVIGALGTIPDIAISLSAEKLGKDRGGISKPYKGLDGKDYEHVFDLHLKDKRLRAFWSPSTTIDMFSRTVPIDYARLRDECAFLKEKLDRAESARITTDIGTDIVIGLKGRLGDSDDGDFRKPGTGGNLPAGEVYISPALGSSNGVIAFDGSISATEGEIIIEEPIVATVRNNFIIKLSGGEEAVLLEAALKSGETNAREMLAKGEINQEQTDEYVKNARNLGELGIGLNHNARIIGNMLEDEKVYSTCHIAIGANYDNDAKALIHLDGLILKPNIELEYPDGTSEIIMEKGELIR